MLFYGLKYDGNLPRLNLVYFNGRKYVNKQLNIEGRRDAVLV